MFGTHFYNRSFRKYVVIFGTMFNNISIKRYANDGTAREVLKVPLAYGAKEKFITRLQQDPTLTKSVAITLPRLNFEMTNISYDSSRKQQSSIKIAAVDTTTTRTVKSQYIGTPYNFDFTLSVFVRNIEDGTQIVEQILPYFVPDYTVTANLVPSLNIIKDIPIVLNSVSQNIEYEGGLDSQRIITWDLTFTVKGYLFGPVANSAIIIGIDSGIVANGANIITGGSTTNLFYDTNNKAIQTVVMQNTANTGNGTYLEGETINVENKKDVFGTVLYWRPNSNTLIATSMTGVLSANDIVIGADSHARYVVSTVETTPLLIANTKITQSPVTADTNDDFGYTIQSKEYPDTL
jgi:hypothetical protein